MQPPVPQIQRTQIDPDVTVLQIAGRITLGRECQVVEWAVDDLIKNGTRKVVFDLAQLEFIDSTGVGIIVMSTGKMSAAGGELRIAALQPRVAELMRVTKLDRIMVFYPTVADAVDGF